MGNIVNTYVAPEDPEEPPVPGDQSFQISLTRGNLLCVGEPILFEAVNVTGFNVALGPYDQYDPLDHEIAWEWNISATGASNTWSAPIRLPSAFSSRNKAYGRKNSYIPDAAGTYTISCTARLESDPTVTATASTTFVVDTIEAVIPSSRTVILYDGSDLTGAPPHPSSERFTSYSSALARCRTLYNASATGEPVRLCILGGETYARTTTTSMSFRGVVDTYGTGRAVIDCTNARNTPFFSEVGGTNNAGVRTGSWVARNLEIVGSWDMTTSGPDGTLSYNAGILPARNNIDNFRFYGLQNCRIAGWETNINGANAHSSQHCVIDNCELEDHLEYDIFCSSLQVYARGTRFENPQGVLSGGARNSGNTANFSIDTRRNAHANIRNSGGELFLDACTFYSQNGWSQTSAEWPAQQPNVRFSQTSGGGRANVQRCVFEGKGFDISGAESDTPSIACNALLDGNIFVATTQSVQVFTAKAGVTIRNNHFRATTASLDPGGTTNGAGNRIVRIHLYRGEGKGLVDTPDPVRVYHNTSYDPGTDNTSDLSPWVQEPFLVQYIGDNLQYGPNRTPALQPDGALTPRAGVTLLHTGTRLGWTNHKFTMSSSLAPGQSVGPIAWFNDVDGNPVDETTFVGSPGKHFLFTGANFSDQKEFFSTLEGFEFTLASGGVTITNNSGSTINATVSSGERILQLDRRHDIVARPGSAPGVNDGQLYAPATTVNSVGSRKPVYDLFKNLRDATTCKGAIAVEVE